MMMTKSKPNGAHVQRERRARAQGRREVAASFAAGRSKAVDVLTTVARHKAIPVHMPHVRTACGWRDKLRDWAVDKAARIVAASIDRSTCRAAVDRLESLKIGGVDWEKGIWYLVNVMKNNIAL